MKLHSYLTCWFIASSIISFAIATGERIGVAQEKSSNVVERELYSTEHIAANKLGPYLERASKWKKDIGALTASNKTEGNSEAILFLGSSSIRLWKSIANDIAPFKPVSRGFGGSRYCDVAVYAPTLVKDLEYRAVAIFVGNDVIGKKEEDKSAEEVSRLAKSVIASVRHQRKKIPILLISVTPTPSRFKVWPEIQKVNAELQKLAEEIEDVEYLDTTSQYLTPDGQPRPELFVKDQLHQNEQGYAVWSKLIVDKLQSMLGKP